MSTIRWNHISDEISRCMIRDRHFMRRLAAQQRAKNDSLMDHELRRVEESAARFAKRAECLPQVELAPNLPVSDRADEIGQTILQNQVVVICGETGSGKSTQLPIICMNHGLGIGGFIGHTQPRRIAARGVAAQIARQVGSPIGKDVGFKIRFDDQTNPDSYVKLMTDGILLAETQSDRFLDQYELLIIDEAHERSLNIDFLLGYTKRILGKRRDLKLVITSATIDAERFAEHFSPQPNTPAPIIEVSGRTFPVEIRHQPPTDDEDIDILDETVRKILELVREGPGDLLVFLPTENDIRQLSKQLRGRVTTGGLRAEVIPLYARLSADQQNQAFAPSSQRKIVIATNVAESSITVPGIRFVVDTGTARISRYAPRSKVQRLPIEAISQASADQRAGRCGRVGPGICVRLYSEDDYHARPKYTTPEIRRTNLASVILQTKSMKLGEVDSFPFLDPPHPDAIRDGYKTLIEIGALDEQRSLTKLGRKLARLPVDPRIGKMIYQADEEGCLSEILVIASALEIQDPRDRPVERQKQADAAHAQFKDEHSDFTGLLNIWDFVQKQKSNLSRSRFRKACQQNFLSYMRVQQWMDIHRQLKSMVRNSGLKVGPAKNDRDAIHRSLLAGLLSGVAMLNDKYEYTGAGGLKFFLWPGSSQFQKKPKWVVVSEIVETAKRYGRNVAQIQAQWIEPLAKHLVKKHYSDPHWSEKNDACMAHERVSLFGLTIVQSRRVNFSKLDPETSRQYLIQYGLVDNLLRQRHDFLVHNQKLREDIASRAMKTRDRNWIVDDDVVFDFYDERIPEHVVDGRSLQAELIKSGGQLNSDLRLSESDLQLESDSEFEQEQFPDQLQFGELKLPIEYRFEPGNSSDGITLKVPEKALGQIRSDQLGWLVPGLIENKIVALIRSLPKKQRRMLVPAPDTAREISQRIDYGVGDFETIVAEQLSLIAQEKISVSDFQLEKLDDTLKFNVQVYNESGELNAEGRDLNAIRNHQDHAADPGALEISDQSWQESGLTTWSFEEIPRQLNVKQGQFVVPVFPALVDDLKSVSQQLFDTQQRAEFETRKGVCRLFNLANYKNVKSQVNWLPDLEKHALQFGGRISLDQLKQHMANLICQNALGHGSKLPRTRAAFELLSTNAHESISIATQRLASWLPKLAENYHHAQLAIESKPASVFGDNLSDIKKQIRALFQDDWSLLVPWKWIEQFPRYLAAINTRLSKLDRSNCQRDMELQRDVQELERRISEKVTENVTIRYNLELQEYRWMLEEYRVSVFAQSIGTSIKISPQRLEKQWAKVSAAG